MSKSENNKQSKTDGIDPDSNDFMVIMREVVQETLDGVESGEITDPNVIYTVKSVKVHYPKSREKQEDLMMCINEATIRSEQAGLPFGTVSHDVIKAMAIKYHVVQAIIFEMLAMMYFKDR